MSGTVYLKLEKNVQIHSRIVSFKDIAQIVADDSALENKIRVLKLPPDTVQGPGRYPVSVMTLIELIQQEFPGIEVNNIGEADFILTLEKETARGPVCLVQDRAGGAHRFFGGGLCHHDLQ